ncbi:hypothetical protein OPV22_000663 [Ensete ventricosum]|uniref:Transcription repressor n=1 Tax=Ensete ventricosum TaxID=4639 RepID=A0AAV8RJL2_ENSVE|nr:hypothetical protein OPV22_000663 [Ensete ventricosum]RWW04499.1 hypothetical protein GW17_00032268 [Ensete ventricosum]RZR81784.1 hypothetical protein BHM03_00008082 [Ensete ventricosum]
MESNRSSKKNGGGKLTQRLARMFRSSCKPSTSVSTNLSSTASTRALLDDAVLEPAVFVPCRRDRSLGRRSLSSPVLNDRLRHNTVEVCSGCRPTRAVECDQSSRLMMRNEKWKDLKARKKERRVRETGGYYETGAWEGRTCPPSSPSSPSNSSYYYYCFNGAMKEETKVVKKKTKKKKKKRLLSNSNGFNCSSSMESNNDGDGFFSSEGREVEEEETEMFFSSRSFSSDSSEFYQSPTSKKKNKNVKKPQWDRRRGRKREAWGVCKGFQRLLSVSSPAGRKEKKGFAVVKRSSDPYTDFSSSMVEMITERQIYGAQDLECLLQSYLCLNSSHLHPLILQAFSDIWVVLFGH